MQKSRFFEILDGRENKEIHLVVLDKEDFENNTDEILTPFEKLENYIFEN